MIRGPVRWKAADRQAWTSARELRGDWRGALKAAGLPKDLIPYSLRHSSIVRGLSAGLPVRVVAALHDTSVAMIEQTYFQVHPRPDRGANQEGGIGCLNKHIDISLLPFFIVRA